MDRQDQLHDTEGSGVGAAGLGMYQHSPASPAWEAWIEPI